MILARILARTIVQRHTIGFFWSGGVVTFDPKHKGCHVSGPGLVSRSYQFTLTVHLKHWPKIYRANEKILLGLLLGCCHTFGFDGSDPALPGGGPVCTVPHSSQFFCGEGVQVEKTGQEIAI